MKSINVALIDDNRICRETFKMILKQVPGYNFTVLFEAESLVGIDRKSNQQTSPDVILLDIMMPEIDGISGIPILNKLFPTTQIVMLTDLDNPQMKQQCADLGVNQYVIKSTAATKLAPTLINLFKD